MTPAPVVGPGNGEVSVSRTSSTCYLAREDLPSLVSRVCALGTLARVWLLFVSVY